MKTDVVLESGLPCAIPTERLILAALLNGGADYRDVSACLDASDLALEAHRRIYSHIGILSDAGRPVDGATVAQSLSQSGQLESVGGVSYLIDLDWIPGIAVDDYIRTVRDKSLLRKTIYIADAIRTEATLGFGESSEILGRAEKMLAELGMSVAQPEDFRQPGAIIRAAGGLDTYLNRGQVSGVPTGFPRLDEMTAGIRPGQLWIIAASTSGGKSTFARQLSYNAALSGYPGALITLEMSSDEVTDGLICLAGGINTQIIRRGMAFERDKTRSAAAAVADLPIYIHDQAGLKIPKLHAILRKLKAEKGITYAIVDYLQLMSPTGRFGTRTEEIGHLTRGLKLIAQDLKIGVIALSQTSTDRKAQGTLQARPQLRDLRESGSIEQDANAVFFLWAEWQTVPMDIYPTELIIAKQRNGPTGMIPFGFRKSTGTFIEFEG